MWNIGIKYAMLNDNNDQQIQCYTFNKKRFLWKSTLTKHRKYHPHPSHSSKQRDEHDHTHELCEEDEWSEEGPHWPQCYVKTAREKQIVLLNIHKLEHWQVFFQYSWIIQY